MFALVESCMSEHLDDRPDLGCAMLLAACQDRGLKANLIKGQTRYLKDMFVNDGEELWDLIKDLKRQELSKIKIGSFKKEIQEKGLKQFQSELKELYRKVIVDHRARSYFNASQLETFDTQYRIFVEVYRYYLEKKFNHFKIIERYIDEIMRRNPRYVGFSLRDKFDPFSRLLRKRIKETAGIPIIVGGSLTPFIAPKKLPRLFEEEYFDYLVIGPGEKALPSLIEALESKKEPQGIPNVFYKKCGKIEGNNLEIIEDLDSLPYPDFSQFDLSLYFIPERTLPLQSARGCSWARCSFCSHHSIYLKKYRTFSVDRLIGTLKYLQTMYHCSNFVFNDEELPPGRAKMISRAILKRGMKNIYLATYARMVNGYNNDNLLRLMHQAGFVQFFWGMESGCQRILDSMNKGTKVSIMSQILKKCASNNIASICWIIFGFPTESKKEAQETIYFLQKHSSLIEFIMPDNFRISYLSPIEKNPEKWGVEIKSGGRYTVKSGMSQKEAKIFVNHFFGKLAVNIISCTSNKLSYFLPSNLARMIHFLKASHGMLSNSEALHLIRNQRLKGVYPLILGDVKKTNAKTVFEPVKADETILINEIINTRREERVLGRLEEKVFGLSAGTLSVEEVILRMENDPGRSCEKALIRKKCLEFYDEVFSQGLAMGFNRSWKQSRKYLPHA